MVYRRRPSSLRSHIAAHRRRRRSKLLEVIRPFYDEDPTVVTDLEAAAELVEGVINRIHGIGGEGAAPKVLYQIPGLLDRAADQL